MAEILFESYYGVEPLGGAYLAHHGVKGQKHGRRQYQNPDGSLTPLGRIHYGVGKAREAADKNLAPTVKQGKDKPNISPAEMTAKKANDVAFATANLSSSIERLRATKRFDENAEQLTDAELKKRIGRMNLEKQYNSLNDSTVLTGKSKVTETLEVVSNVAAVALPVVSLASAIYRLKH